MIPSVKTLHARPTHLPPVRMIAEASILFCPHCLHVVGTFRTKKEKTRLQSCHVCEEKRMSQAPSAPIPYS
ncbi:hypothetical protein [Paracidobacterium acidisoli]|uniref:Uncharacterized protein n=1 Tax=Paracidobacterium acidisoli TaxID=2303751 RepID=A0A372IVS6_9BACT|nr:hypothetical protein [Paracidobacterium acidisoli]MBT9329948.1 hypothetical protein [Paracidobacterium acidisoli]